ncbi:TRAP-type C4-dicarboxylate transport system permease small subunit [Roseateles asaccharophilus]|uniref:TRAP transporter small permease protein n=1 Tax=Roseateles asaccharophilus TaxID=582607 RepID=A0A4V3CIS6_9BURK|nr:TRAP-type C4-dicarboxylate transport system permease small subunit [Roseateles asaccharophilus]
MSASVLNKAAAPASSPAALFTRLCASLSKLALVAAVAGLLAVVLCVQYQVVGRYLFNDTPTWAEALAMLLVLYVTALGVAVGVRDAGHIGLESLLVLLPERLRRKLEILIHLLVALFGGLMLKAGWLWTTLKWSERKPMLGVPEGMDYLPLVIAGALIVLFSIEHIVALLRGHHVEPAWN